MAQLDGQTMIAASFDVLRVHKVGEQIHVVLQNYLISILRCTSVVCLDARVRFVHKARKVKERDETKIVWHDTRGEKPSLTAPYIYVLVLVYHKFRLVVLMRVAGGGGSPLLHLIMFMVGDSLVHILLSTSSSIDPAMAFLTGWGRKKPDKSQLLFTQLAKSIMAPRAFQRLEHTALC